MAQVVELKRDSGHVARPLSVLVELIRKDIIAAKTAAEAATGPYYVEMGKKLIEAKEQLAHGDFMPWVRKNFKFGDRQARMYMQLAKASDKQIGIRASVSDEKNFREAVRNLTENTNYGKQAEWRADLNTTIKNARSDAERLKEEALTVRQEREAEKKLALQLIDIGFKALASKLHPDKGGSRDAMARLNRVRDRLKNHA